MDANTIPGGVLEAYGFRAAELTPITVGLINRTYRVDTADGSRFILQRLHPIFEPEVNLDLEAVTAHLAVAGLATPRLVRTRDGAPWVADDGNWRVISHLEGRTLTEVASASVAREAGALAGRFHRATDDLEHTFAFSRGNVHDTPRHLERLETAARAASANGADSSSIALADAILAHARALEPLPPEPARIVHGDLKITNLLFETESDRGLALLDLDTLARGSLSVELGDALRSWCNPMGESSLEAHCDLGLAEAALEGFRAAAGDRIAAGLEAVPLGLETIAIELAARFATDVFEDRYFGWDASRFRSRVEHNRARAASQLALARSVAEARPALEDVVRRLRA